MKAVRGIGASSWLLMIVFGFVLALTLIPPIPIAIGIEEDDGYVYPDDATEEEKKEIDEQEREAWEDAGRPGEIKDNGDDDNDDNDNRNGDNNNDDNTLNTSPPNNSDIVGTVQNISQPVNILSHTAQENRGYLHVVGEVKNGLSRSIDFVQVTGTFYDAGNSVIGTDFTFTDPNTLEAGETAPFDLTLYTDAVNPSDVANYKLRVSWQ
jgi:hypothetical protein